MSTIGKISSGFRFIQDGKEFNHLFPVAVNKDKITLRDADVVDTVRLMGELVVKTRNQTQALAQKLKGSNLLQSCQNIWEFLYHHIQYKLDQAGLEQLRQPARSWSDRHSGIDCDCFSIFVSSILTNLNIPHAFRITKYDRDVFQHVYVIVPIPNLPNKYYTIDCVLSQFNYEKPYSEKKDFVMLNHTLNGIDVAILSGFDSFSGDDEYLSLLCGDVFDGVALGSLSEEEAVYQHLISTRNIIAEKPYLIAAIDDPEAFLQMLDYAIAHWNTPQRDEALEILAKNEYAVNKLNGFFDDTLSGEPDELSGEEELAGDDENYLLGKPVKKRFFKKVRKSTPKKQKRKAKKAAWKARRSTPATSTNPSPAGASYNAAIPGSPVYNDEPYPEDEPEEDLPDDEPETPESGEEEDMEGFGKAKILKKIGSGIKKAAQKVGKSVVRFNPLTITARSGLLLAMKMNIGKMSSKLKWGYATEAQAAAKGISKAQWQAAKKSLADTEKLFEKIGGKKGNLKNPITKGKAGGLNGETYDHSELDGFGVAPIAAGIAAALPVIAKVILSLKNNKLMTDDEAKAAQNELDNSKTILEEEYQKNPEEYENPDKNDKSSAPPAKSLPKAEPSNQLPKWVIPTVLGVGVAGIGIYFATRKKPKNQAAKRQSQSQSQSQSLSGVKAQPKLKRIELK